MKKILLFLIALLAILGCDQNINYTDVAGKKYVGKPVDTDHGSTNSPYMDEGYGQRGYYEFSSEENRVDFIWPGSDIIDGGTYTQTGLSIEIKSIYGDIYNLTLSDDGIELTDSLGIVYRDENYPWE